ncbi:MULTISPECIES: hypothetical protein [unclassified Streptomyces]|uniref:hypothetical protein n=1 Tax=unclassified Streptomyces TaxID=2593676 RepID=UPI0021AC2BAC|nr:hypothetical protein [Streptomyces sp. PsTaAH-137]
MSVRILLAAGTVTGLLAQCVKPVGDALAGKTFLFVALLSGVAYVFYDALRELSQAVWLPARDRVDSRSLGSFVAEAFQARRVEISFFGYTGETLYNELYHRLEHLEDNPGPTRRVVIRVMVPDFSQPMRVPSRVGDDDRPQDSPEFRERAERKCQEYDQILSELAQGLTRIGRMDVSCEYRVYHGPPLHKLCIFNRKRVLHGLYNVSTRMPLRGPEYYDPKGFDTDLTVLAGDRGTQDEAAIAMWVKHFDDLWRLVAEEPAWRRAAAA